jgi:hypothetical protein
MVLMQLESVIPVAGGSKHSSLRRLLILSVLFIAAFGIRLYHINEPPLGFHATRQYRSLIIARGYYFERVRSIPEWKKEVAYSSQQKQRILEPPILEFLVSVGYRLLGGERFWLSKFLSSLFWLIGGGFLYLIGKRIADADTAMFGTAFYLLLPFAVVASRSFQPDPLMVMLMLVSIFAIVCYYDSPSNSRLAIAATVSALAFVVKPGSVFAVLGAFMAAAISIRGIRRAVINWSSLAFITVLLLPTMMIYIYNTATGRFPIGEAEKTLLPQLWLSPFFWRNWITNIGLTLGFIPFIGGILGILFFREGVPRSLVMGLWTGYVCFALVLSYNLATHDYYQLQFIPIVGLCIGPLLSLIMSKVEQIRPQLHWRIAIWSVLLLALILSMAEARSRLVNTDAEHKVRTQREIGELVKHSRTTVFLSSDYGVPLQYEGLLSGSSWPLQWDLEWERLAGVRSLAAQERFKTWYAKESPDYFIVEDLGEFERQPDLKEFLSKFPVVSHSSDYVIFKLKQG